MERPRAVITGVGAYYPDYILTNEELSRMVDTTDEWIMTRIGIKERRILRDADKGSAYLGARAVEDLFRKTGLKPEEVELIRPRLNAPGEWTAIGTEVPGLAGEFFLVTGSGKYFRNIIVDPEVCLAIIELDEAGVNYRIRWGLVEGGRPTSELPTHLMNHEVKKKLTNGRHRVIYHAHTTNTIALTFVLPLDDKVFTRELWESATECPVVFPDGVGVIGWMVPGGRAIAEKTAELMEKYDVAICRDMTDISRSQNSSELK